MPGKQGCILHYIFGVGSIVDDLKGALDEYGATSLEELVKVVPNEGCVEYVWMIHSEE